MTPEEIDKLSDMWANAYASTHEQYSKVRLNKIKREIKRIGEECRKNFSPGKSMIEFGS